MNKLNLFYNNTKIEEKYKKKTFPYKRKMFFLIDISAIIYSLFICILSLLDDSHDIAFKVFFMIFFIFTLIYHYKSKEITKLMIFIEILMSNLINILYYLHLKEVNQNIELEADIEKVIFYLAINLILTQNIIFHNFEFLSRIFNCFSLLVFILLTKRFKKFRVVLVIQTIILFMILIVFYYLKERFIKENFLKEYINKKDSKIWKYLMLEINPSFITVLKEKKDEIIQIEKKNVQKTIKNKYSILKRCFMKKEKQKLIRMQSKNLWIFDSCNNKLAKNEFQLNNENDLLFWLNNLKFEKDINILETIDNCFKNFSHKNQNVLAIGEYLHENHSHKLKFQICPFEWNENKSVLIQAQNIDIEEQLNQMKVLDKYKDDVLASVTHDLRTPLNGVNYMIEKAKEKFEENNPEEFDKYYIMAKNNIELLMSLISDILDYSQIKNNRLRINFEEFNLQGLLDEVFNLMNIQAELKKLELVIKNYINPEKNIITDKKRLKQVFINLISNAIKFTLIGKITIKLKEIINESNEKLIKISVRDTGLGMSKEVLANIFTKYSTFDNENKVNANGIGLGLNICKSIVGFLGPEENIKVKSTVSVGSTFSFKIFANSINKKGDENHELLNNNDNINIQIEEINSNLNENQLDEFVNFKKKGNILISDRNPIKKLNVLIVDDTVFNLFILNEMLKSVEGFEIKLDEATNGKCAVEIFEKKNALDCSVEDSLDLIILDVEMPIMNGIEAVDIINNLIKKQNYLKCKVAIYSGYTLQELKLKNAVADYFLMKPVKKDQLYRILNNVYEII